MRLSFSTLGCPEWRFVDIISAAVDLGYQGIEVRGVQNVMDAPMIPQFSPEKVGETRALLQRKGLRIECLTSACFMNVAEQMQDTIYQAKAYVDVAHDLGVTYIRVLADFGPAPKLPVDEAAVCANIRKVAEYAQKKDVWVLVESNGHFADSARLKKLICETGENVGAIWDVHHPFRYMNESPAQTVETLGSLIKHVHLKDSMLENGAVKYVMMGCGDLPVRDCVAELQKIGYAGSYCLEWLKRWDLGLEEPGIAFGQFASFMKSL